MLQTQQIKIFSSCKSIFYSFLVRVLGLEPRTYALTCHYNFHYHISVFVVWTFSSPYPYQDLGAARQVSTRFYCIVDFARDCHFTGFPEFEQFYFFRFRKSTPKLKGVALPVELHSRHTTLIIGRARDFTQ